MVAKAGKIQLHKFLELVAKAGKIQLHRFLGLVVKYNYTGS